MVARFINGSPKCRQGHSGSLGSIEGSVGVVWFIGGLGSFRGRLRVVRFVRDTRFVRKGCRFHSRLLGSFKGRLGVVGFTRFIRDRLGVVGGRGVQSGGS